MIDKANAKELFEGVDTRNATPEELMNSRKLYNYIIESAAIAKEQNVPLDQVMDEGIFSAIALGALGATAGPSIMKAVCKILGISENGTLGNLLTSRVVLAAVCGELGLQF